MEQEPPSREEIFLHLRKRITEFGKNTENLTEDTLLFDEVGLDSIEIIELCCSLNAFGPKKIDIQKLLREFDSKQESESGGTEPDSSVLMRLTIRQIIDTYLEYVSPDFAVPL